MSQGSVAFFLPTRKGSKRVKEKNTRTFANMSGGLLENKLQQLVLVKGVDEIILSTNDEKCMSIAEPFVSKSPKLKIVLRPDDLCLDSTNLQDLIRYVPTITNADHIVWGHVTTPLADSNTYEEAIAVYKAKLLEGYDSLVSVVELRNFLLDAQGRQMNNSTALPWPRTQDLAPLYEINHVVFIANRETYCKHANRLGNKPALYVMDKIASFDVDWMEDFKIAEMLYQSLRVSGAGTK